MGVTRDWRELLDDVVELVGDAPVWLHADNAYYNGEIVRYCLERGWDFSISVTHRTFRAPILRRAKRQWNECWAPIRNDGTEQAARVRYRPSRWPRPMPYVVVRTREWDDRQARLFERRTVILVSRDDLPLDELVRRHRAKQGRENVQKGPLIELDLHHPPCARLTANRAFYLVGQIAQNLLVATQYALLPESARRHGLRPIIRDLVRSAGKLVRHAKRWTLRFAKTALRLDWLAHAADRLDAGRARNPAPT